MLLLKPLVKLLGDLFPVLLEILPYPGGNINNSDILLFIQGEKKTGGFLVKQFGILPLIPTGFS